LAWEQIEAAIRSAAPHVDGVCVTGGEPLLRKDTTIRTIRLTRCLGLRSSMVTNGYWYRSAESADRVCRELDDAGLQKLAVSFDRFHDRIVSSSSLDRLLAAGARTSICFQLQYCGDRDDEAYRIATAAAKRYGVELLSSVVLPFGRGRNLATRSSVSVATVPDDPCGVAVRPVLTPEGELFTCCGPARGAAGNSPLRLKVRDAGYVGDALSAGAVDPILNVIHVHGPHALLKRLHPATQERVAERLLDSSICSLCRSITDDEHAVHELSTALEEDRIRLIALSAAMQVAQDQTAART